MEIRLDQVSLGYGDHVLIKNLDMTIGAGERICIPGPSGCGKTSFLQMLLGSLQPLKGSVSGVKRDQISMVFQEDRLCENLSAAANIEIGLLRGVYPYAVGNRIEQKDAKGSAKEWKLAFIQEQLKAVGISTEVEESVSSFSGGMKRRVAILRAVLSDSELLLLDEPFKGLDDASKMETMEYVKNQIGDRSVILITHDSREAEFLDCQIRQIDWLSI